mmetsp:Transcript_9359/g.19127  ORF Transcript_9359/g.19127 Transcript_9359/m.19127 type:complete len:402 (-) Transcript_9359:140-1345(-)
MLSCSEAVFLLCVFVALPYRIGTCNAFGVSSTTSTSTPVRVFDNVFSSDACRLINQLSIEHSDRAGNCDGSSIFYREEGNVLTPLESAIDSALTALGDTSDVVEYWSRENYMNIDAHADIDEGGLLDDGERIRCPIQGHILYLVVGKEVRGPTFIFPDKLVGWGCDDTSHLGRASSSINDQREVEMVTVPAVEGRVVRFDGRAIHAVPKPADRWLLSKNDERLLREKDNDAFGANNDGGGDFWEEEEGNCEASNGRDETEDYSSDRRSVLLFNTWKYGPAFVDEDPAIHMPLGIELSGCDGVGDAVDLVSKWEKEFGKSSERVQCNPKHQWKDVSIINADTNDPSSDTGREKVRVSLMGNKRRRCHPNTSAKLSLHHCANRLRSATREAVVPTSFTLKEDL